MPGLRWGALLLPLLLVPPLGAAEPSNPLRQNFSIEARGAPAPLRIGGARVLRYELHLTNFAARALVLEALTMRDPASGQSLGTLDGDALARAAASVGGGEGADPRIVEPGRRAIVYVDLALPADAPARIEHLLAFGDPASTTAPHGKVAGGAVAIDARTLPELGPPLRGGPWAAVYEPGMKRGHRRVPYAVAGQVTIPGRHAIDWMRVGENGAAAGSDDGGGAEVLAVADATVASLRDGIPEPAGERPAVTLEEASGNYVALDLGDGRFAFYEHLMPGLKVKAGDRVRRGQVIGRLGSTGQASRPHLHFHVADASSTLGAEGLPYQLRGGTVLGHFPSIEAFDGNRPWIPSPPGASDFPPANAVMRFP